MSQNCPACGQPVDGRFCTHCGVSLDGTAACAECGHPIPAGGRFCNQCGAATPATRAALAESAARRPSSLPWIVTTIAVAALAVVLILPRTGKDDAADPVPAAGAAAAPFAGGAAGSMGDPRSVDLSSMTPRQQADALYNRVMRTISEGDSAQAKFFIPMALAAYGNVPDLDLDAHYHLAMLQEVNGDARAVRAEADTILQASPSHLFGLFEAGRAEQQLGNATAAKGFFQKFLDDYDAEVARKLPEYEDHKQALPAMRREAEEALGK